MGMTLFSVPPANGQATTSTAELDETFKQQLLEAAVEEDYEDDEAEDEEQEQREEDAETCAEALRLGQAAVDALDDLERKLEQLHDCTGTVDGAINDARDQVNELLRELEDLEENFVD
jgi:hypothetical protein